MNQERLERGVEIGPSPDVDVRQCGRDIEHSPGVDLEAERAEDSAEVEEVGEEKTHGLNPRAGRAGRAGR